MMGKNSKLNTAGALLFLGGLQWVMAVMAAETLFPDYSTRANDLSDLASTVPPNTSLIEPSATIFNAATFLLGLMVLISAALIYFGCRDRLFVTLFSVFGVGAMGVGVFPGDTGSIHGLSALVTFFASSLSAMAAWRLEKSPLSYISVIVGLLSLTVLLLAIFAGEASPFWIAFGRGGEERMVAYPVVAWIICFGGYLMGVPRAEDSFPKIQQS